MANTTVQELTVVNQGDTKVDCRFIGDSEPTGLFSFSHDDAQKHCYLKLIGSLDYERETGYVLRAEVFKASNARRKRQTGNCTVTV